MTHLHPVTHILLSWTNTQNAIRTNRMVREWSQSGVSKFLAPKEVDLVAVFNQIKLSTTIHKKIELVKWKSIDRPIFNKDQ